MKCKYCGKDLGDDWYYLGPSLHNVKEIKHIMKLAKPGALKKALGIPLNKRIHGNTLRAAAKRNDDVGRMARMALVMRKPWKR